jgi:hypothetical protein
METEEYTTSWHSYPKIHALGHREVTNLLLDPVLVEEKIDGSQFSFGRFNGELRARSKGAVIDPLNPPKMFAQGVEVAGALDLHDGWTYRGEYLQKPKHNALAYDRTPEKHIIIFDINDGHESYLDWQSKRNEATRLGLEVVPVLHTGTIATPEFLKAMFNRLSVLGGQTIEGVVIKNYARFGKDGHALMGKYVSEAFKEVHRKDWKERNPSSKDVIEELILSLKSEARWNKAIQHLKESNQLEGSPRDIGNLIKHVQSDIIEEEYDYIVDTFWRLYKKRIMAGVISGLPQWYKEKLLQEQFSGE